MRNSLISFWSQNKLANFLSREWLLKFVSLILAATLWYFVGGEDKIEKNVMVPIEIINLPRDLVISNQFKKEIKVTVRGPRSKILELSNRAVTRQVDLSDAVPGTRVIDNDNDHIPVPRDIIVQRVQPSSIILSLDKLVQKQFPITARTMGSLAEGFFVKSIEVSPNIISITGPQTAFLGIVELSTQPINLANIERSIQLQVPLNLRMAIVELIGETSVTVDITVGFEIMVKTMKSVEVHAVIDGVEVDVWPKRVQVVANIPKIYLKMGIDPASLFSLVARPGGNNGKFLLTAIPKDGMIPPVEIISIIPNSVSLADDSVSVRDRIASQSEQAMAKKEKLNPVTIKKVKKKTKYIQR